jgi:hypothetical protein
VRQQLDTPDTPYPVPDLLCQTFRASARRNPQMTVNRHAFEPSASVRVAVLHGLASEMQQPQLRLVSLGADKNPTSQRQHAVQDVHAALPSQRMMERGWSGDKDLRPASKITFRII